MTAEIIIALITVAGTSLSAFFGVVVSSKMTAYRLCELEKKVEKHNTLVERMVRCEQRIDHLEQG